MGVVRLRVQLPEGASLAAICELLERSGIAVQTVDVEAPAAAPEPWLNGTPLTGSELAVLRAFARCASNAEIAAELYVQASTVRTHVESIYRKLEVRSRGQALGRALRSGVLTVDDLSAPSNGGERSA